jgi:hypothetical protein
MRHFIALLSVLALLFSVILLQALASEAVDVASGPVPHKGNIKFNPAVKPEYLELLKSQADDRKKFYADQASAIAELKKAQAEEQRTLVDQHREARVKFMAEKHSAEERKSFFKGQREQMVKLRQEQKEAYKKFGSEWQARLADLHQTQSKNREALAQKLSAR